MNSLRTAAVWMRVEEARAAAPPREDLRLAAQPTRHSITRNNAGKQVARSPSFSPSHSHLFSRETTLLRPKHPLACPPSRRTPSPSSLLPATPSPTRPPPLPPLPRAPSRPRLTSRASRRRTTASPTALTLLRALLPRLPTPRWSSRRRRSTRSSRRRSRRTRRQRRSRSSLPRRRRRSKARRRPRLQRRVQWSSRSSEIYLGLTLLRAAAPLVGPGKGAQAGRQAHGQGDQVRQGPRARPGEARQGRRRAQQGQGGPRPSHPGAQPPRAGAPAAPGQPRAGKGGKG